MCSPWEVVVMETAVYGRMQLGKCVESEMDIGCKADVIDVLDRACSGRSTCDVRVPNAELDMSRPCMKDLRVYLEASYKCVAGWFAVSLIH
jgi:hypothetical protein